MNSKPIQISSDALLCFERVEIFLRVNGRLPNEPDDALTQDMLDTFCEKYEADELTEGIVPLDYLYRLIKFEKIKASEVT